jgi:hypothetical protein
LAEPPWPKAVERGTRRVSWAHERRVPSGALVWLVVGAELLALLALPPASRNEKPRHRAAEEEKGVGFGNGLCIHK